MASWKYETLSHSTLDAAYTAGSTTITVRAGDGAKFSSAGNFHVALDNPPSFFLLCTSRSGDVLTVSATGQEGTTAANRVAGTLVTEVITKTVLDGIRGDICQTGTFANRPAAEKAGILYLPSDGISVYRDTGAAWTTWGPIFPLTKPLALSGLTTVGNAPAAALETKGGFTLRYNATSGTSWSIKSKTRTDGQSLTVMLDHAVVPNATVMGGIVCHNASNQILFFGYAQGGASTPRLEVATYSDLNTLATSMLSLSAKRPRFLRMLHNSQFFLSVSEDGNEFVQVYQTADPYTNMTKWGSGVNDENTSGDSVLTCYSWVEA